MAALSQLEEHRPSVPEMVSSNPARCPIFFPGFDFPEVSIRETPASFRIALVHLRDI